MVIMWCFVNCLARRIAAIFLINFIILSKILVSTNGEVGCANITISNISPFLQEILRRG